MAMGMTIGNMAQLQTQSSLALGQSQANSLGLGGSSANALAVTNLMGGDSENGLMGGLMSKSDMGGDLISKSLTSLNKASGKSGLLNKGITPSFNTQKTILGAGLSDKGNILNTMG